MGFSILIMHFIVYNFYTGIDQIDGISVVDLSRKRIKILRNFLPKELNLHMYSALVAPGALEYQF